MLTDLSSLAIRGVGIRSSGSLAAQIMSGGEEATKGASTQTPKRQAPNCPLAEAKQREKRVSGGG